MANQLKDRHELCLMVVDAEALDLDRERAELKWRLAAGLTVPLR